MAACFFLNGLSFMAVLGGLLLMRLGLRIEARVECRNDIFIADSGCRDRLAGTPVHPPLETRSNHISTGSAASRR